MSKKRLILIDANSLIYRAYYATSYSGVTSLMKTSNGIYTNALFAFINMIDQIKKTSFDYVCVAYDTKHPLKRKELYKEYKAGRQPMPEELIMQLDIIKEYLKIINFNIYELPGYEADDIIGTLAKKNHDLLVDIYSSDRDLLQLVEDNISVNILIKGMSDVTKYTPSLIKEKFNLTPNQLIDLKALMGDKSDNIPGVSGVGPKGATDLLVEYNNLDNVYNNIENITKKALKEKLIKDKDNAYLSKTLGTIDINSPVEVKIEDLKYQNGNYDKLLDFYQKYELNSFYKKLKSEIANLKSIEKNVPNLFEEVENKIFDSKKSNVICIDSDEELNKIIKNDLCLYLELDDINYHIANIIGLGIYDSGSKNKYFLSKKYLLESKTVKNYFKDNKITKFCYDYKKMYVKLMYHDILFNNCTYDLMLASYLVNPDLGKKDIQSILYYFNHDLLETDDEVYGKGAKKEIKLEDKTYNFIAEKSKIIFATKDDVLDKIKENNEEKLLDIELKLSKILGDMEYEGIKVDRKILEDFSFEFSQKLLDLEAKIYNLVQDNKFNISSPKQLAKVLFEDLKLPVIKKNKTGSLSTDQEVLEKLKKYHPVIPLILEYRELEKLNSTYIEGIKKLLENRDNDIINTIYLQTLTATGRLSSIEPNLQNIPIKTETGRLIRKMFIPKKENNYFIGIDYSQIELRVLAAVADEKNLMNHFKHDLDIHSQTAKEVFHVEEVTPNLRRMAKAVNFGIIYGISSWGLSEDLNISPTEAKDYINKYLDVYPNILKYMQDIKEYAKLNGYVKTILNRRRYIPDINSSNYVLRQFGERLALNSPIQGSAADILKLAMIKISDFLAKNNYKTKILLQVHDELIFEVPSEELEIMKVELKKLMESAYELKVKLVADQKIGKCWYEL